MRLTIILQVVSVLQLLLLVYIFFSTSDGLIEENKKVLHELLNRKYDQISQIESLKLDSESLRFKSNRLDSFAVVDPQGVVLLVLTTKQPPYFDLLQYKINNILQNIPPDWVIQIFYRNNQIFRNALERNPGLNRSFLEDKRIISMEIPKLKESKHHREDHYRLQPWLWKHVVAEHVLALDGNFAICSNSPYTIQDFVEFDHIGVSSAFSEHDCVSLRKRSSVLFVLSNSSDTLSGRNETVKWKNDDHFYYQKMLALNDVKPNNFNLPRQEDVVSFAACDSFVSPDSLFIAGKLETALHADRDALLNTCVEGKTLFKALHHPGCFGSNLKREACESSICALNLNATHRSC